MFNPINIFRVVDCREDEDISDDEGGLAGITAEKFIVLEYGGLAELTRKKERKQHLEEFEEKTLVNFFHQ